MVGCAKGGNLIHEFSACFGVHHDFLDQGRRIDRRRIDQRLRLIDVLEETGAELTRTKLIPNRWIAVLHRPGVSVRLNVASFYRPNLTAWS